MSEAIAKVCHYTDVPAEIFGDQAPGVTIRWLIDEDKDGAPVYALRGSTRPTRCVPAARTMRPTTTCVTCVGAGPG